MTMGDPKRLLARADGSSLERALLESGVTRGPDDATRTALWAALAERLPPVGAGSVVVAATVGAKPLGKVAALAKLAALAGLVAVGAAAAIVRPSLSSSVGAPPEPPPVAGRVAVAAPAAVVSDLTPPYDIPASPASSLTSEPTPAAPGPPRRAVALSPDRAADAPTESALLLDALRALRTGDCRQALALSNDALHRFPGGTLAEERETLAIQALDCLGRAGDAAERRVAFELLFPASVYVRSGTAPR